MYEHHQNRAAVLRLFLFASLMLLLPRQRLMAQENNSLRPPAGYLSEVSSRLDGLRSKMDSKLEGALAEWQSREQKIYRKLLRKDSAKAKDFLESSRQQYQALRQRLEGKAASPVYDAVLDTLRTTLNFFDGQLPLAGDERVQTALDKLSLLEGSFGKSESVRAFLKERQQYVTNYLGELGLVKELKKLNKQVYYYSAQVAAYRELLTDRKKLERKVMEMVTQSKAFQDFMKKNSILASMFRLPDAPADGAPLAGLQRRSDVQAMMQQVVATGGPDAQAQLNANMSAAMEQLKALQAKVIVPGFDGGGIPDFKVNNQKTKTFLQRLEVGANVQSQKARHYFPVTSDLGLSLGYKLNDKSVIGIGASYKLGLGTGWNNVSISHQGAGLRSFIDYKIKGSFYVSGGYEQNYRSTIRSVQELKDFSAWQASGLIGAGKRIRLSKKAESHVQLLWDFMSHRQVPRTQPILLRIGYKFHK
jgi:hypothetical protein